MAKVRSLKNFVSMIDKIQRKWTALENNEFVFPWFRGHSDKSFSLVPSIYRSKSLSEYEDSYRHDFHQKGFPYLNDTAFGVPVSDWEWYFLMQHYGLPTRLLDWSEGSLIALYFSTFYKSGDDKTDPCVWVLNPFDFNRKLHERAEIFIYTDAEVQKYLGPVWDNHELPEQAIAFQPAYKSKRISAQKGCFTIHGKSMSPLEDIEPLSGCLEKIEIDVNYLDFIKAELVICGITESTLFPELSGLARELKEYWK